MTEWWTPCEQHGTLRVHTALCCPWSPQKQALTVLDAGSKVARTPAGAAGPPTLRPDRLSGTPAATWRGKNTRCYEHAGRLSRDVCWEEQNCCCVREALLGLFTRFVLERRRGKTGCRARPGQRCRMSTSALVFWAGVSPLEERQIPISLCCSLR